MNVRERVEEQEYQILSPLAAKSREARRKHPMEECDFRTKFQRDRDRILHSKSFRRLKHKTQVYIVAGDHYRTRMTHSLEVSQISRTIARGLRLNEDLAEAIALGHDVGHTPFGHAGESVMAELTGHFTHNEQSLRVVEFLERGGQGLNLTFEVKDGIVNHTGKNLPQTLEGRIVRTADRIAYLCHDYDDSLRAGLIKEGDLPAEVYDKLGTDTSRMITSMVSDMIMTSQGSGDILQSAEIKQAMDTFREFHYFLDNFAQLPKEFIKREARWGRQKIVTDYVAGLTDSYAVALFEEIFIPPVWQGLKKIKKDIDKLGRIL